VNQNEIVIPTDSNYPGKSFKGSSIRVVAEAAFLAYMVYKFYKYIEVLGDKKASKKS